MKNSLISRRQALLGAGAFAALGHLPVLSRPAVAQPKTVKLTLPWLAQGATAYAFIAKEKNLFGARGLNVEISRGFGSVAAVQAVANKQFDFGIAFVGPTLVGIARGFPLLGISTFNYDALFGLALRADSAIRSPKDIEGKKIGVNPTSAEVPFWPAFCRKAGIDASKVTLVQMDARILERSLADKQVDAITCVGSSSLPVLQTLGADTRFMLWSTYGLTFYANGLITREDVLEGNTEVAKAISEALQEALQFQLLNPDEAIDILARQVPELTLTRGWRESARLSQGLMQRTVIADEAMANGLGYTDLAKVNAMTDLMMEFAAPADGKRPDIAKRYTNDFVKGVKLTAAQWQKVKSETEQFGKLLA